MRRRSVFTALALMAGAVTAAPASVAVAEVSIIIDGHGNGHGVGLSQWGAYGYAVDHGWSSAQILDHYYGGTVAGTVALDTSIGVRLQRLDDQQTAVVSASGQLVVTGAAGGPFTAVVAREIANGTYRVWARADGQRCPSAAEDPSATGWSHLGDFPTQVEIRTLVDTSATTNLGDLPAVCEPSGTVRSYRGFIRAVNGSAGENRTVNVVPVEQYLRAVIAKEMSPSWATAGGGSGAQALQAQAVAARSYALAYRWYSYAEICDSSCQAYMGAATRSSVAAAYVPVEYPSTDAAVLATAGVVRRVGATNGPIAITMFSASNGGWSSPGSGPLMPFPAVLDEGDDTALNPNHSWTVTLAGSSISAAYPAIGTFTALTVLSRNGFGEWNGRVVSVQIAGTAGAVTTTGADFRSKLGLKDTWFNVRGAAPVGDICSGRNAPPVVGATPALPAARYTPMQPSRLIDTRYGTGTAAVPVTGGCTMVIDPGVDASVTAVAVNLTTVLAAANGYVAAYPCGVEKPLSSVVQSVANRVVAGMAVVPLGPDGTFCVYSHTTTNLVVDLFGTYASGTGSKYEPLAPSRVFDSRGLSAPLPAGTILYLPIGGSLKAPAGATGAALTVQSIGATRNGYVTVYPCSATVPLVSSVTVNTGVSLTNHVETMLDGAGRVCVYISAPMHIVVDMSGWFGPTATTEYYAITPVRALDTRYNTGLVGGFTANVDRALTLAGTNGLPPAGVLRAVMAQVTGVGASAAGYITVHPCMSPVPSVSMVRYIPGSAAATSVAGPEDALGRWCISTSSSVHVLVDINGYYA
jgi:SpoIID/LytB domain protein